MSDHYRAIIKLFIMTHKNFTINKNILKIKMYKFPPIIKDIKYLQRSLRH